MRIFGLVIMKASRYDDALIDTAKRTSKINSRCTWSAIDPVIHDLERLRANTWDQDKITHIQNWLKDNFEVK